MQIEFEMKNDILIVVAKGEIDHHSATMAREEIDKTFEAFLAKNMILDFQGITFMDSSGIGMVMGRYNKVNGKGGELYIAGCSEYMRRILDMAGIFTIAKNCSDVKAAIKELEIKEEIEEAAKNEE